MGTIRFPKFSQLIVDEDLQQINDLSPALYIEDIGKKWQDLGAVASTSISSMTYCGNGIVLFGDDANHVFRSTDYGANWDDLGVIATDDIVAMTYCGNGIVLFGDDDKHVFRSTDYGATWSDLGITASGYVLSMVYCGNGVVLLGDSFYHVYRSTDYGVNWSDLGELASGIIYALTYCGNGIVLFGGADKHVFRSINYGADWSDLGVITVGDIYDMTYCGNGIVLLVAGSNVWRSTDYGATWSDLGAITAAAIHAIIYCCNGIALLGDWEFRVWCSTDYGATWSDLGVIASAYINIMTYCGNGIVLLGDNGGNVFRSDCAFKTDECTSEACVKQAVLTPAGAIIPTSAGAEQKQIEGTNHSYYVLAFDTTTVEKADWQFLMPSYKEGNVKVQIFWVATPITGGVVFDVNFGNAGDSDSCDPVLTNEECAAVTVDGVSRDINISSCTLPTPFNAGEYAIIRIHRETGDGGDTMAGDAEIIGVILQWV